MERRLAAILAADVVGYSRLMGQDEVGTLQALKALRVEVIDPKIAEHKGRIFKSTGDGVLAEFPSVVNAVACAIEIQRAMDNGQTLKIRIGVNLGDVIIEGDDVFGDGVNLAARLEGIAPPGGVAISSTVKDHLGSRLDVGFTDLGEQTLKNVERAVRVYSIAGASTLTPPSSIANHQGKPSIAVLPFTNMSGDPEQEYFADGITDDLITDLSKVSGLSVIGRNSVFTYKGKAIDAKEVGRRFDVKTLLEGSVRKAGTSIRVNAQLVSTSDGRHIWADRYDREMTDIFAIQDEITHAIVEQLKVKLLPRERSAIAAAPTCNIEAYNYYLQGRHFYYFHTTPHTLLAQRMFKKAIELDSAYARAYAGLADCASFLYINQYSPASPEEILIASSRALEIDPDLAEAHAARGFALHNVGRYDEAVKEFEHALALNDNLYEAYYFYGWAAKNMSDWKTAARMFGAALAPNDGRPSLLLGQALEDMGQDDEARIATLIGIERAERALVAHPDIPLPAHLGAGALASLGERERAFEWSSRALTIAPDDPLTLYNIACTYSQLGELDRAVDLLERWYEHANPTTRRWLANDTDLDNLRRCQRFQHLLQQLG